MCFIIWHELQGLNDSYMKACFLKCFTDSVGSVLCFLENMRVDIVDCSAGGCVKKVLAAVNFCRGRMFL